MPPAQCDKAPDGPHRTHDGKRIGLFRLDVAGTDDLAPLFGFVGEELAELGRRERKSCATESGKSRVDFGISEGRGNLALEPVNKRGRGVLRRPDSNPVARLITR